MRPSVMLPAMFADTYPWQRIGRRERHIFLLIRHGRTDWNAQGRFCGWADPPLNADGHSEARKLRPIAENIDVLLTSPLTRAVETAAYLGQASPDAGLRELNHGRLEGLTARQAQLDYRSLLRLWERDPAGVRFPGGESLDDCHRRIMGCLEGRARDMRTGLVIGAVTHQAAIATVVCQLKGLSFSDYRDHKVPNGSVTTVVHEAGKWRLADYGWMPR